MMKKLLVLLLILLGLSLPALAQVVTQGFKSDGALPKGLLVSLDETDPTKVVVADETNIDRLHGIVVDPNDAPFTLSSDTDKTFIATNGRFEALVNIDNGDINSGDYITLSTLAGIGAKATERDQFVIGKALQSFTSKNTTLEGSQISEQLRGSKLGKVIVELSIAANPLAKPEIAQVPDFIQRAAESIAGKSVSIARVYIAFGMFVVSAIVAGTMLYAGIRNGMVAIGRNPLSKRSIIKSLIQVIIMSVIILVIGVSAVYLVLKF